MSVIKVNYVETAKSIERRPSFGIDIPPIGVDGINKNKIPTHIAGTFYDLFSPETSKKEEREKLKKELQESEGGKTRNKNIRVRGNPKNCYTFKAMFKTYFQSLVKEITSGYKIPLAPLTDSALNNYFMTKGSSLAKNVVVKRKGLDFVITLPLYELQLKDISGQLNVMTSETIDSETNEEVQKFIKTFWQKSYKLLPIDFESGEKLDAEIDKISVSLSVDSSFPKAQEFYRKYLKHFKVTTIKNLPKSDRPIKNGSHVLSLPSPTVSPEPEVQIIKSPFKGYPDRIVKVKPVTNSEDSEMYSEYKQKEFGKLLLNTEFYISAVVVLPYEEARFYVQSEHPKEVEVLDFVHSWYTNAMNSQGTGAYPTYKHSMAGVREKNKPYAEFAVPKTNKDKLALTKQNRLIYLPEIDLIDGYRNSLTNATYDNETESYSFSHNPTNLPRYQLIYVDWVNNRAAYTTSEGKLTTLNLSVIYSVTAANYVKELNTIYTTAIPILSEIIAKSRSVGLNNHSQSKQLLDQAYNLAKQYSVDLAQMSIMEVSELMKIGNYDLALLKFYKAFIELIEIPANTVNVDKEIDIELPVKMRDVLQLQFFIPLATLLGEVFVSVFKDGETILKYINKCMRDVPTSLEELAFLLPFKQARNYPRLLELTSKELEPYLTQDKIDLTGPVEMKNFEGVDMFLAHQAKALKKLKKKPKLAAICGAAGAGKTLICIADIIDNLGDGTVKKPLVLCPNGLIKDYINEANFASNGKLNVVPFDTTVFNNYANVGTDADGNVIWDYTRLKSLIDNAPINTIFVLGYDVISGSTSNKIMNVYGNEIYESYSHLEFFGSCNFDGVWCDESHYLKGGDSLRVLVNELLIVPIPYKRLLTGTIVPNNLTDLVSQMMLMDPSILGTERQFRKQFDVEGRSEGIFSPKADAFEHINKLMKQQCTFINIQRKEWADVLPELHEYTVEAHLTPNQKNAYKFLINQEVDKMAVKLNIKDEHDDIFGSDDSEMSSEEADEKVEKMFDSAIGNLAAVEAFLANPESLKAELQQEFLSDPDDYISPKGKAVIEIIKEHFANPNKYVGKILIFCNTHASVAGIWNSLPPELKAKTIYYSAKKKADMERQFKTDSTKKILLGVSQSLDTGLNLQIADTIIRVDCVWTPGKLEQGNARINRPSLKEKDENGVRYDIRKKGGLHVYYIMVDGTIDTLKYAKLTSKTVSLIKFYNAGTADFEKFRDIGLDSEGEPIEPIRVSLELLREGLTWDDMTPYKEAYEQLRSVENEIYHEYANRNPDLIKPVDIIKTGIIKGSKVLRNVPYVAGAGIFNSDQLGLVPYLQYKEQVINEEGEENWDPEGLLIHTEFGEGSLIKETAATLHLRMDNNGIRLPISPSVCFVITKKLTSTMEIRDQLAKTTGLEVVDIQLDNYRNQLRTEKVSNRTEKEKLADQKREAKKAIRDRKEREAEERKTKKVKLNPVTVVEEDDSQESESEYDSVIDLKFTPINEMLGLTIFSDDPESEFPMFKKYGFKLTKPYLAAEIKRKDALGSLLDKMHTLFEKGVIDMEQKYWDMWSQVEFEFSQGRSKLLQVTQTPTSEIQHFFRTQFRRVRTPNTIRALPMIVDGKLFMVIDIGSHVASTVNKLVRQVVSGVTWKTHADSELLALYPNKSTLVHAISEMKKDGWTIGNEKELKQYFNATKVKPKR